MADPGERVIHRRRLNLLIAAAVTFAAGAYAGATIAVVTADRSGVERGSTGATHRLTGMIVSRDCADFENVPVLVTDGFSNSVARGSTGVHLARATTPDRIQGFNTEGWCRVPLAVEEIPPLPSYVVEIGDHGGFAYPMEELESRHWNIELLVSAD